MKTDSLIDQSFDELQSIETVKTAIATSRKTLMDDGILLFCWGIVFGIINFWKIYNETNLTIWWMRSFMNLFQIVSAIFVIGLTAYYIFVRNRKIKTHTAISTWFVWIGIIIAANLNIIVTKEILSEVNFVLLQPLQMVLLGFALFVTGGIYRYYLLSICGVLMWVAAGIGANYELTYQFLIRGIAEVICFVIPGILMFLSSKNKLHV